MQAVTLAIAGIFSILVLYLRPAYALAAYIICLLWYPTFLVVTVGTIDISASRIVVVVLLLRCLCNSKIQEKLKWSKLDFIVVLSMIVYVVTYCFAMPIAKALENRSGFILDTFFAYYVVRCIVTDRATLVTVIKCVALALVPLAILGVVESVTYWHPFLPLVRFCPWAAFYGSEVVRAEELRFGFARAVGPFSHSILFGCTFGIFLPLIYYLRREGEKWRVHAYVLSGVALLGALSSMSSGPWVMILMVIFCLIVEKRKEWVKPLLVFFVFSCIFIEIASNRPFYHVIASWANPTGGSGWHRARLLDLAIERFDEWWLIGYGEEDPGWGPELGMAITDVTNEFILAGVRYGVLGMIALCWVIVTAFRCIKKVHDSVLDIKLKSLAWALGSILLSIVVTWMSVSFFGQLIPLFYCILGIIGSYATICGVREGY
jgi:hypothetical protein